MTDVFVALVWLMALAAPVEIIDRIRNGEAREGEIPLIDSTSRNIIDLSLCGLGQVAPMPLLGMIRAFPDEFEAHIQRGECPAGVCPMESRPGVLSVTGAF